LDSTPKQKRSPNSERRTKRVCRSTDPCPRSIGPVDWDQPRAGSCQSINRSVDHSFATVDQAVDRAIPVHVVHTGRLGGRPATPSVDRAVDQVCLGLLQAPFFLPLTFGLCAISFISFLPTISRSGRLPDIFLSSFLGHCQTGAYQPIE